VKPLCSAALLVLAWGLPADLGAAPRVYRIGIVTTDAVDAEVLPPHLADVHARAMAGLRRQLCGVLEGLGRAETVPWMGVSDGRRYTYSGAAPADFVAHLTLHHFGKIYRNESVLRYSELPQQASGSGVSSSPYEIYSRPAIQGRLEVELVDPERGKTLWSALQDSSAIVPHEPHVFLYNPSRYPGWTHPALVRAHLAGILRLQAYNHALQRAMVSADRWFVSTVGDDLTTATGLLDGLVASLRGEIDRNLPLEGRIADLLPDREGKPHLLLNLGSRHGLRPRLRLDLWRPLPSDQKVGQIEVVTVDSLTAVARVRKVDRGLRRRGEGPGVGDRAVSRRRPAPEGYGR